MLGSTKCHMGACMARRWPCILSCAQVPRLLLTLLQAMKALWPCPTLHVLLAPLYSNRAAALLSLGKPWQALQDCQAGLKVEEVVQAMCLVVLPRLC